MAGKPKRKEIAPAFRVDSQDEPSADWGWHGSFPRATVGAALFTAAAMFLMLIGNHTGRTEDLWLIGTGVAVVAGIGWLISRRRTSWRK